ncbi:hypothetical protein E6R18_25135 [Streptomyces sp. A1277]|uniref:hypothetical protein n=1 Tax=Streptomyces sp. A1277 TaxID=2563103 RepID=UPI0010A2A880|nr:hypothetical protein [Streptomyces sp. A1277]THA29198.1 hypothetical protein E6R18_25135 [Streptomyces sp. A1277]
MGRYAFLRQVLIIGPAVLGLLVLTLIAMPGDLNATRLLVALAVYSTAVTVGTAALLRHPNR